ncbi:hypothetical protein EWM64_g3644 [Hericium alpestre]|uniref:ELYS-like domain-containing protein n=1 Tax=Hericium alpestre TaxID=135208 RepID=A0A4Z0A231_9AGAM|nr:hypothetical protein EWM64_g3644 [Hericium alpestre]
MDVDAPQSDPGNLLALFDLTPEGFPWREPRAHEIETRRARMSDLLIFDILLASGGIREPDTLWPPADVASLRRLLDAIQSSSYDALKKDCLIYFLLKWHQDGREEAFKEERCIPPQFSALSDAYWHLDSGINVERAISLLSDVRLNRDYTSKILQAISLSDNANTLILRYIRTAKPLLTEPDDIDMYAVALAENNLMEAWLYQRSFPETTETRSRLLRKILSWSLSPAPRTEPLSRLIAFPFSPFEQNLIHAYALEPPSSLPPTSVAILQDLVCVRLIHSGNYAKAVKLDRQFMNAAHGQRVSQAVEDRRKMVDDAMALLPSIERLQIEEELSALGQGKGSVPQKHAPTKAKAKPNGISEDLSMSWEEVQPVKQLPTPAPSSSGSQRFTLGLPGPAAPRVSPIIPSSNIVTGVARAHDTYAPAVNGNVNGSQGPSFGLVGSQAPQPLTQIPLSGSTSTRPSAPSGLRSTLRGPRLSQGRSSAAVNGSSSLFGTTNASASSKRNAFYNPPEPSAPSSRLNLITPPQSIPQKQWAKDHREDADVQPDRAEEEVPRTGQRLSDHEEPQAASFAHSLFGRNKEHPEFEDVERRLPGAFHDHEPAPAHRRERSKNHSHQPPSPSSSPPPNKTRQTRASRARKAAPQMKESTSTRSVPVFAKTRDALRYQNVASKTNCRALRKTAGD